MANSKASPRALRHSYANAVEAIPAWRAAVLRLDRTAADVEGRWGVGRLESLALPGLAAKFGRAQENLERAIQGTSFDAVAQKAVDLERGWLALERAALDAGYKPNVVPGCWCAEHDGLKYAIVRSDLDVSAAGSAHPDHVAVSIGELLRVFGSKPNTSLLDIKNTFPGAVIARIGKPPANEDASAPAGRREPPGGPAALRRPSR